MKTFSGFPPGKVRSIGLPEPVFTELLPIIDDLAELHVTLFSFWALYQKDGNFRYLRQRDFTQSATLMESLSAAGRVASCDYLNAVWVGWSNRRVKQRCYI